MRDYASFGDGLGVIWLGLTAVLHCAFALAVWLQARKGQQPGNVTWLVPPSIWASATLLLGPYFAAVYWFIHHSSWGGFNSDAVRSLKARRRQLTD